jgi:hypothetical protein
MDQIDLCTHVRQVGWPSRSNGTKPDWAAKSILVLPPGTLERNQLELEGEPKKATRVAVTDRVPIQVCNGRSRLPTTIPDSRVQEPSVL